MIQVSPPVLTLSPQFCFGARLWTPSPKNLCACSQTSTFLLWGFLLHWSTSVMTHISFKKWFWIQKRTVIITLWIYPANTVLASFKQSFSLKEHCVAMTTDLKCTIRQVTICCCRLSWKVMGVFTEDQKPLVLSDRQPCSEMVITSLMNTSKKLS